MADIACIPRPTVEELRDCIVTDYQKRVLGGRVVPDGDFMHIAAYIWAGAAWQVYGDMALRIRNSIDIEFMCCDDLIAYAKRVGYPLRPARAARGYITITGNNNAVIPGTISFVSSALTGSQTFTLDNLVTNPVTLSATGSATLFVTADQPGTAGNLLPNSTVSLVSAIAAIDATATITGYGVTGGAAEETCEELRVRLMERRQRACVAGNLAWYSDTIRSFPGVSRVCFTGCKCSNCCQMPVTGYVWMHGVYPETNGEPPPSILTDIENYIWGIPMGAGYGLAPVGDYGQLFTPKSCSTNVVIRNLETRNPVINDAIVAAYKDFFATRTCVGETICQSELVNILLSTLPTSCFATVELSGDCVTVKNHGRDFQFACGRYPVLGSISYRSR